MHTVSRVSVEALQNRQLLLSVKLVNLTYPKRGDEPRCSSEAFSAAERFEALELAYQFGLWNARQFRRARELTGEEV